MARAVGVIEELRRADCRATVADRFSVGRMVRAHLNLYRRTAQSAFAA